MCQKKGRIDSSTTHRSVSFRWNIFFVKLHHYINYFRGYWKSSWPLNGLLYMNWINRKTFSIFFDSYFWSKWLRGRKMMWKSCFSIYGSREFVFPNKSILRFFCFYGVDHYHYMYSSLQSFFDSFWDERANICIESTQKILKYCYSTVSRAIRPYGSNKSTSKKCVKYPKEEREKNE